MSVPDDTLLCPHCFEKEYMEIITEAEKLDVDGDWHVKWQILCCLKCKGIHIVSHETDTTPTIVTYDLENEPVYKHETFQRLLYPQKFREFRNLPKDVKQAYQSAQKIFEIDTNAFVVMVGRTLEFVCEDKGASGKALYNKLNDLANRGELPETIANIAQQLRLSRNVGAHAAENDISREEATTPRKLLETILEYLYEAPAMLAELEQRAKKTK